MSARSLVRLCFAGLTLAVAITCSLARAQPRNELEIKLEADASDIDRKNDRLLFYKVQITQGELGIRADSAQGSGLDFENSDWLFSGNVQIKSPATLIEAREATLTFLKHRLRKATVIGEPVVFQHNRGEAAIRTEGRAEQVDYDFETQVLRLAGDAWLAEGTNQINASSIVYDIAAQRVVATSNGNGKEGVRITITPPEGNEPAGEPVQPPPEDGSGS